jgi:endonuclease/exonuclease/phosphatase family metal-dependent hydrolase
MKLRIVTHNIHKGLSQFNQRMMVHELRDGLRGLEADIVFLQEVQGQHQGHARRYRNWPEAPQYEFLADQVWQDHAYGRNAVYDHGHHGNAILSRYPILSSENQDVSGHALERRGILHCVIGLPQADGKELRLHCMCVHLALTEGVRRRQIGSIVERMQKLVPEDEPLIVAGDFNDWRNLAGKRLVADTGLAEAFRDVKGKAARSFPSVLPFLRLDRIYTRGFTVIDARVHHGGTWARISDHAALSADVELQKPGRQTGERKAADARPGKPRS